MSGEIFPLLGLFAVIFLFAIFVYAYSVELPETLVQLKSDCTNICEGQGLIYHKFIFNRKSADVCYCKNINSDLITELL